jgi:RHS repeat-associated protein
VKCSYAYDNNGYISNKTWTKPNGVVIYGDTITRNAWGDIETAANGGKYPKIQKSKTYGASYDAGDQIVKDSIATHNFDGSGNDTLIKGDSTTMALHNTANNVLSSINTPTTAISYGYDAFFNRVAKTENGIEKRYVNNAGIGMVNVLMEQNVGGTTTAYNIYGTGLIARLDSAGKMYYYISDIYHNVVALVDDSANITDTYLYNNKGKIVKHTGTSTQPYTWLGEYGVQRENDSIYYVRARYYDATRGRFFNRDPYHNDLTNPQTINRYVYAMNNAINRFDWNGLYGKRDEKAKEGSSLYGYIGFYDAKVNPVVGAFEASAVSYDLLSRSQKYNAFREIGSSLELNGYKLMRGTNKVMGSVDEIASGLGELGLVVSAVNIRNEVLTDKWDAHTVVNAVALGVGVAALITEAPVLIVGLAIYGVADLIFGLDQKIDLGIGRNSNLWK